MPHPKRPLHLPKTKTPHSVSHLALPLQTGTAAQYQHQDINLYANTHLRINNSSPVLCSLLSTTQSPPLTHSTTSQHTQHTNLRPNSSHCSFTSNSLLNSSLTKFASISSRRTLHPRLIQTIQKSVHWAPQSVYA